MEPTCSQCCTVTGTMMSLPGHTEPLPTRVVIGVVVADSIHGDKSSVVAMNFSKFLMTTYFSTTTLTVFTNSFLPVNTKRQ